MPAIVNGVQWMCLKLAAYPSMRSINYPQGFAAIVLKLLPLAQYFAQGLF